MTNELTIKLPALKRPTLKTLQTFRSYVTSIESDESTEEATTLVLATVLKEGEDYINGKEYEKRLKPIKGKLGFQHALWLREHQSEFPELMALLGEVYIVFAGLVVVHVGGGCYVPCLFDVGREWYVGFSNLAGGFVRDGRLAIESKPLFSDLIEKVEKDLECGAIWHASEGTTCAETKPCRIHDV